MQHKAPVQGHNGQHVFTVRNKLASAAPRPRAPLFMNMMTSQTRSLPGIHNTLPHFKDQVHVPPDGTVHNEHPDTHGRPIRDRVTGRHHNGDAPCLFNVSSHQITETSEMVCNDATH